MRLSIKARPTEVALWVKSQEDPNVHIPNISAFGASWIAWWIDCQPAIRSSNSGWPLPQVELQSSEWGKMLYGGKNGLFLFVMAMSWWANSIDPTQPPPDFCQAIADLKWVLEQLTNCIHSPPAAEPAPESTLGKRRVRLSEKASDSTSQVKGIFKR